MKEWDLVKEVDRNLIDCDVDCSEETFEIIVKRLSDSKFFKFLLYQYDCDYDYSKLLETKATETFKKERIITQIYYE
jgi:hypothetical protein